VLGLVEEGIRAREFRRVDPNQFLPSAIGSIVHYFLTAPLRQKFVPRLNFNTPQAIQERRAAVLDYIAAALFADRDAGIKLAAKIAARRAATLRREAVAARSQKTRPAASPASDAARPIPRRVPTTPQSPAEAIDPASTEPSSPGGYRWVDRWFPDFETANRIMAEEAKRSRKSRAKRLTTPGEKAGPK